MPANAVAQRRTYYSLKEGADREQGGWSPQSATPRGIQKGLAPSLTMKRGKKETRQRGLCLFSIVVPKDYSNSAILFQKDCLAASHTVRETAGSKQSEVLSSGAVPPLPESQFALTACQALPEPAEGVCSGREELGWPFPWVFRVPQMKLTLRAAVYFSFRCFGIFALH